MVQADSATLIYRDLPERRIELAVIPLLAPTLREDLDVTLLYQDFWHVVAGVKSKWSRRRKIDLEELVAEPWCATPLETSIGSLLGEAFAARGLAVPRLAVASVLSPKLVVRLLEDGRLVAVMSDSLLNFFYAKRFPIKKLAVDLPHQQFAVAIVTLNNRTISPVAQLFIDRAREVAGDLAKHRSVEKEVFARTVAGARARNAIVPGEVTEGDIDDALRQVRAQMWGEVKTKRSTRVRKR